MKAQINKLLLSGAVIIVFGTYVILQRGSDDGAQTTAMTRDTTAGTNTVQTNDIVPGANNTHGTTTNTTGQYTDGTYTGTSADAFYGRIQVQAVVSGGEITDIVFLDHPSDRGASIEINNRAMPLLKQEAIQAQSAQVDTVSGATDSSIAFRESLSAALAQAQ